MATFDATSYPSFSGQSPLWGGGYGRRAILKFHVDMSKIVEYLNATISGAGGDVLQLWDIPAACKINGVLVNVLTGEANAQIQIGDDTDADGFLGATSIASAGILAPATNVGFAAGKVYGSTDTLDITFGGTDTDIDTAVFDVYVDCTFFDVG